MTVGSLAAPPPPRSPWQRLYASAHRARARWWTRRAHRLPRPVVSVGNLHWGGGGKTPVTAAIARHLRDRGLGVAILSRGYGRSATPEREVRVVSTGSGPRLPPALAGDEPVLLAHELPGVAVVVAGARAAAGRHAIAHLEPAPDLFVLDDGFSHLALARDLDVLVFPAADPFGGGRLWPSGRLREPLAASARADAALLTGELDDLGAGAGDELARALSSFGFRGTTFAAPTRLGSPTVVGRERVEPEPGIGETVVIVSGVARNDRFATAARGAVEAERVAGELAFPDHHPYPEASLERIRRAVRETGAGAVLTTGKDRVKLDGRLHVPLLELPLRAEPDPSFWDWLDRRLEPLLRSGKGAS